MTMNLKHQTPLSVAERKKRLVAEGAAHRDAIVKTMHAVEAGMPGSLAKSVAASLGSIGLSLFKDDNGFSRIGLSALVPLVIRSMSALSKISVFKPLARGTLIAAVAATVVAIIVKKKNSRAAAHAADNETAKN
jgi:hypothetical protein